jgi:hypothetical protein
MRAALRAALSLSGHTLLVHLLAIALVLLHGLVMRGPTQPVCEIGTPCSAPAAHVKLVFHRPGVDVSATTDAQGRYSVRLRRATYTVRIMPSAQIGRGLEPTRLVVRAPMRADFNLDTGIR